MHKFNSFNQQNGKTWIGPVKFTLVIILLVAFFLTACSGDVPPPQNPAPTPEPKMTSTDETAPSNETDQSIETESAKVQNPTSSTETAINNDPTDTPVPEVARAEATATSGPEPTTVPLPPPTIPARTELESTDPAAVQLASGDIQLVEFFAFW